MRTRSVPSRRVTISLCLIVFSLFLLACDVGSLVGQVTKSQGQATTAADQGTAAPGKATTAPSSSGKATVPSASGDIQSRISNSLNHTILLDEKTLTSYHLEASGTEPNYNKDGKKVEPQGFTLKADVSDDNVHFWSTTKAAKETSSESYIMNGSGKDGGKGYSVVNGQVKEDLFAPLAWVMLPLDYGLPLIYGSMGPLAQGQEAIDGRSADKYDLDTARAPTGAAGLMQGFGLNVYSSKGTAWVDKQTGALLKMSIDYERDVQDSGSVVGRGSGHIDLLVTQVGKVTVKLPDTTEVKAGGMTAVPTKAAGTTTTKTPTATPTKAGAKTTPTKTPTALPAGTAARVGQRVVLNNWALTLTKVQTTDGPTDFKADSGNTWVLAYMTVENVGNEDASIDPENFKFIEKSGVIHDDLWNGPSLWDAISEDVFDYYELAPGGKLENKILVIQLKKTLTSGLKLQFTLDNDHKIIWNLNVGGPAS